MTTYSFTVVLEGFKWRQHVNALYAAGLDDALIHDVEGKGFADFDREARSLVAAVASACADIDSVEGLTAGAVTYD